LANIVFVKINENQGLIIFAAHSNSLIIKKFFLIIEEYKIRKRVLRINKMRILAVEFLTLAFKAIPE